MDGSLHRVLNGLPLPHTGMPLAMSFVSSGTDPRSGSP